MDKLITIIQARVGSSRLYGKVLMDLEGASMLERVIYQAEGIGYLGPIVVATTSSTENDIIEDICDSVGCDCFRTERPESDVLGRFVDVVKSYDRDIIVRVTADDPFFDYKVAEDTIRKYVDGAYDFVSSSWKGSGLPIGVGVEVFSVDVLEDAFVSLENDYFRMGMDEKTVDEYKEHITPYFYKNPDIHEVHMINFGVDYSKYRLTVDTLEDLRLARFIYYSLGDSFTYEHIIELLEEEKDWAFINKDIEQVYI